MKKIFLFIVIASVSISSIAQGNSQGKGNDKSKDKNKNEQQNPNSNSSQKGYEKNQPKKVTSAFYRDYPGASNVTWSKYKGDYTATFSNGPWRSTAVYHANGERRDTRTPLTRKQLPGTIWDKIFKRDNLVPVEYIQIESPSNPGLIFRIVSTNKKAYYYDQNGNKVSYNY
jgi:hypothetical protein